MKQRKNIIQNGAALLLITFVITIISFNTNNNIRHTLSESIHQTLNEVTEQQSFSIYRRVDTDIRALQNLTLMLNPYYEDNPSSLLTGLVSHTDFSSLILVDAQGNGVDYQSKHLDFSSSDIYRRAMRGETVIGSVPEPQLGSDSIIPVALPVYYGQDTPQAVLIGGYPAEALYDLIPPSFSGEGKSYLVNSAGELLIPAEAPGLQEEDNRFFHDFMNRMNTYDGSDKTQVLSDISKGLPGHIIFDLGGSRWHCHYYPIEMGGWYVFTILSYDAGAAYALPISTRLTVASALIVFCFLLCLAYIVYSQRQHTGALERAAFHDELCNCPNLAKFILNAQDFIDKHPDDKMAIVKLDIGGFKLFNQTLGKSTGDQILAHIANALRQVAPSDCYCRAHNDEFYALFICDKPEELSQIHDNVQKLFYEQMGSDFPSQLRIIVGRYYMFFENCRSAEEGVEKANIAHRKAKELGKELCIYDEEFVQRALWKKQVIDRLDDALAHNEFLVYLQAQYILPDEVVSSAEALVRWKTEKEGLLAPDSFIPILEEDGLITKVDFYVWDKVCQLLREWIDAGLPSIEIAVNFSRKHLANSNFVQELCKTADKYKVPHRLLAVELTENALLENEKVLFEMTDQLHEHGFLLSMDDFGTGYSSLSLLKNLPVDILKVDRSFFTDNRYKTRAKQLISSVMRMAEQLNMTTIAEGVEHQEHVDFLREIGCNKVQGYYYERPVPAEEFWSHKELPHMSSHLIDKPTILEVGDIKTGRGELGEELPVAIYRLFQYSMREVLKQRYGDGEMVEALRACGWLAGRSFATENLDLTMPIDLFFEALRQCLRQNKIGLMEVEQISEDRSQIIFTICNDLDCSGMPDENATLCQYGEGFFVGVLYEYTKKIYSVSETDCWGNGANVCRFMARIR